MFVYSAYCGVVWCL